MSALVPGFYEPPDPPVNPLAQQAEDDVIAWMRRIGFVTSAAQEAHLRSFRFGLYHGIATPAVERSRLALGIKWFCWGSLADDQYDHYDRGERAERLDAVIDDVRAIIAGDVPSAGPANPVVAGFAELWPELTADLSRRGRRRIATNFLDYLQAVAFQNRYHAAARIPDPATFITLRRHTIAMVFQADVLEAVSQVCVPDALRDSRPFRELVWCFADITAWHNDVYGLDKDIADGQTCNMVRVVAASERCTLPDAVERVLERAKHRQRLLLEIERELPALAGRLGLPSHAASSALALARDLRAYAYANLVWIGQTERYDLDRPRVHGTFDDLLAHAD